MPDNALPPVPSSTPPAPSSTPLGGTPPAAPAPAASTNAPAAPAAWRAPTTAPAWAAGKTSEEILGIATQLVDALVPPTPTTSAAPAPSAAHTRPDVADDDFITGAQMKRMLASASNANADAAVELAASSVLGLARQQYPQDFARYGPEISQKLAGVPRHLWTLDNLTTVVKLVRSDHLEEIVRERAAQFSAGADPGIRSTGAAPASAPVAQEHSLASERIPAEWKRRAVAAGVTEATVAEFCRANDMSSEAFYKQFETPMNRIVEDIPQRKSV